MCTMEEATRRYSIYYNSKAKHVHTQNKKHNSRKLISKLLFKCNDSFHKL